MAVKESALRKMLSKSYKYRDLTIREITNVMSQYKSLKPVMDNYVFNDGKSKELLSLTGTVPVSFKGTVHNIPICLWLLDTHPYNPPICFVKPTSSMMIKTGKHIDANGKIYLPYLHEWKHPESDLFGLIQVMIVVFGEEPPVYSRPTTQAPYPEFPAACPPYTPYMPSTPFGQSYTPNTGRFQGYPYPSGYPTPYNTPTTARDDPPRAETLTRCLAEMIVRDLQPLSIVEDEGFQGFVRALNPSYNLPSRKQLTETDFVDMFDECKGKVRQTLQNAPGVVLTTEKWTSESTEVYLTVTSHVIQNWQMKEFVLETHRFPEQPTADSISFKLKRMTDEWGITEKVVAVVTDIDADIIAAVQEAGWCHYPCFAHTLNLVVKDSLNAVPEVVQVLGKCNAIVSFFRHSTEASENLRDVLHQLEVAEHKPIQSVDTHWKSVFDMLERLYEQKEAVTTALCLLEKSELCLDTGELSLINQTVDALKPFEEVTREVSSEKHVSGSKVIPLVSLIHRAVAACEQQGSSLATQLARQCQQRFKFIETIHGLAASTFLDVRFKHLGFKDKDKVEAIKKRLFTEMQEVYLEVESASTLTPGSTLGRTASSTSVPVISSRSVPSSQGPALASGSAATKGGFWADFDTHVLSDQHHQSATTDVLIEMCRYLDEKLIPRDKDPLLWWQEHEDAFPALSKLAVKYLGIVATSVPAERIFLKAEEVVSQKRSRLHGETVNMLLFLNKNL